MGCTIGEAPWPQIIFHGQMKKSRTANKTWCVLQKVFLPLLCWTVGLPARSSRGRYQRYCQAWTQPALCSEGNHCFFPPSVCFADILEMIIGTKQPCLPCSQAVPKCKTDGWRIFPKVSQPFSRAGPSLSLPLCPPPPPSLCRGLNGASSDSVIILKYILGPSFCYIFYNILAYYYGLGEKDR